MVQLLLSACPSSGVDIDAEFVLDEGLRAGHDGGPRVAHRLGGFVPLGRGRAPFVLEPLHGRVPGVGHCLTDSGPVHLRQPATNQLAHLVANDAADDGAHRAQEHAQPAADQRADATAAAGKAVFAVLLHRLSLVVAPEDARQDGAAREQGAQQRQALEQPLAALRQAAHEATALAEQAAKHPADTGEDAAAWRAAAAGFALNFLQSARLDQVELAVLPAGQAQLLPNATEPGAGAIHRRPS